MQFVTSHRAARTTANRCARRMCKGAPRRRDTALVSRSEQLTSVTLELTRELGELPSLRQIAKAAGMSVAGVATHYPLRDDLLDAAENRVIDDVRRAMSESPHPSSELLRFLASRPCHAAVVLDLGRRHHRWPDDLIAVLMPEGNSSAWSDLISTIAYVRRSDPEQGVPEITTTELDAIAAILIDADTAARGSDGPVEPMSLLDLRRLITKSIDDRVKDPADRTTHMATMEILGDGAAVTARQLTQRLGSGMSRIYRRQTMSEVRSNFDDVALTALMPSEISWIDATARMRSLLLVGRQHPNLIDYLMKKDGSADSPFEQRIDLHLRAAREADRLRHPELSDKLHRAILIGSLTGRFRNREIHCDGWVEAADFFARLRPSITAAS